jgi:hypothetical protein
VRNFSRCGSFSAAFSFSAPRISTKIKASIKHLGRYCDEFSYRFNRRGEQLQMFDGTLKNLVCGEVLPCKKLVSIA